MKAIIKKTFGVQRPASAMAGIALAQDLSERGIHRNKFPHEMTVQQKGKIICKHLQLRNRSNKT